MVNFIARKFKIDTLFLQYSTPSLEYDLHHRFDLIWISSGRVFVINTRDQRNLLHTWIVLVIVKQRLVQIGRMDGSTEYLSQILAAIRSPFSFNLDKLLVMLGLVSVLC